MKNGAYQQLKQLLSPTRWTWTGKRLDQNKVCQVFLKKDTSGGCQNFPPFPKENPIEILGGWSPSSCKDKVKKIKNWFKNQSLLSIDQKKELEMTPALQTEAPVASTSSKPAPEMSKDKPKGPQKKQRGPKNHQGKGKGTDSTHRGTGSPNWSLQLWTVCSTWPELSWNSQPRSRKG
ncbi:hypothetical protein O181_117496 [Austropuccinia psidii MF-1]|uniref:Uncharacterized protein n=1 Tax=Austropuccinia psidii MF-1 TaxID=1389203 RepID=A0A9Q3KCS2_9BASI|nr:hypothetical protein [Austropuccinia psidii MF-1]